jgi:hypothetical protein
MSLLSASKIHLLCLENGRVGVAQIAILTYMSIHEEINTHLMSGRLVHLPHAIPGTPSVRIIIVNRDVLGATDLRHWSGDERYRLGVLRGDLDRFIGGGRVSVMLSPRPKPATTYLKRLDPVVREVWEIRSCDPSPGVRVLGRFVERDHFLGLAWNFRENLSSSWDSICDRCLDQWRQLLPNYSAHMGRKADDYVSQSFPV